MMIEVAQAGGFTAKYGQPTVTVLARVQGRFSFLHPDEIVFICRWRDGVGRGQPPRARQKLNKLRRPLVGIELPRGVIVLCGLFEQRGRTTR